MTRLRQKAKTSGSDVDGGALVFLLIRGIERLRTFTRARFFASSRRC